jgi:hypothetical protein
LLLHFDTVALRRSLPPAPPGSPDTAPDVAEYSQLFDISQALDATVPPVDIDTTAGDSVASPGVTMFRSFTARRDDERIGTERYGAVSPTQIRVNVRQRSGIGVGEGVPQIIKDYAVWVRERHPTVHEPQLQGNLEHRRVQLCGSYRVNRNCIERLEQSLEPQRFGIEGGDNIAVAVAEKGVSTTPPSRTGVNEPTREGSAVAAQSQSETIGDLIGSYPLQLQMPSIDALGAHYAGKALLRSVQQVLLGVPPPAPPP